MAQEIANVGEVSPHWKKYVVVWLLAVVVVSVAAGLGLWGTLFGMAGLTFAFWGVRSLWRFVGARSVEEVAVGTLGGRDAAVELEGQVRAVDEPLVAPLSGEECVAYKVEVAENRPRKQGEA
jgi:hypothetical protein